MTEFQKKLTTTLLMLVLAAGTSGGSCSGNDDDDDGGHAGEWDPADETVTADDAEETFMAMCAIGCPAWSQCESAYYDDYYYYDDEAPPQTTEECIAECEREWTEDYDEYLSSGEYDGLLSCLVGEFAWEICYAQALLDNGCDFDAAEVSCRDIDEQVETCFDGYYDDYDYDDYYDDDYYINEPDLY